MRAYTGQAILEMMKMNGEFYRSLFYKLDENEHIVKRHKCECGSDVDCKLCKGLGYLDERIY